MLRMSKLADYAFIILSRMLESPEVNWSASALSAATTLPLPTVAKLMKLLSKGGLVCAQRGAAGGYKLMHTAKNISIARIIEAVDGPIGLTECAGKAAGKKTCDCAVENECPVREGWARVNRAIMRALEDVTLADLLPPPYAV